MGDTSVNSEAEQIERRQQVKWFVRLAGMQLGPMPWNDLADMARRSELCPADEIRGEDEDTWTSAAQTSDLFPEPSPPARRTLKKSPPVEEPDVVASPPPQAEQLDAVAPKSQVAPVADLKPQDAPPVKRDTTDDDVMQMLMASGDDQVEETPVRSTPQPEEIDAADSNPNRSTIPLESFTPLTAQPRTESNLSKRASEIVELAFAWPKTSVALLLAALLIAFLQIPSYEGERVTGRVTLDDAPVRDANVSFYDKNTGLGASATLDQDGFFELSTLNGGVSAGHYSVCVYSLTPGLVPERYFSIKTSDLSFEVPGNGDPIEIKLISE